MTSQTGGWPVVNDSLSSTVVVPDDTKELSRLAKLFPVRDGEKPWTAREVKDVADDLVSDIDRLTSELAVADAELSDLLRNSGDGAGDDQADSGSSALEREQELTLVNNTRDMLAQTQHALQRISAGSFATCESCGKAIGKARLQAFPRATLCVECKQREERR
ncbi:DnaK suppressor protein [Cellulomonas uda]|nr:DnaK suppressor protein [Cellulomonas uda]